MVAWVLGLHVEGMKAKCWINGYRNWSLTCSKFDECPFGGWRRRINLITPMSREQVRFAGSCVPDVKASLVECQWIPSTDPQSICHGHLDQHTINISINTWSTVDWHLGQSTRSTLCQLWTIIWDGTVVRALVFRQCGPGLIPAPISGLGLLVLYFAPTGFYLGTPVFPSPQKNNVWFDLIVVDLI